MKRGCLSKFDILDYLKTEKDFEIVLQVASEDDAGDGRLMASTLKNIAKARKMRSSSNSEGDYKTEIPASDVAGLPRPVVNYDSPLILTAKEKDGKLVMPKEWRDDDDEEDSF